MSAPKNVPPLDLTGPGWINRQDQITWQRKRNAAEISGDLLVVVQKVTNSLPLSLTCAAAALVMFYGFWFGYSYYRRVRSEPQSA